MYNLFKLDNGLRVVLENIDYVNSVSVGLWVKNGSRNENKNNNGISHFIEHMLFKGTQNRSALEIAECIENVGGQINAFTGKESTCFYIKALDSHLELAIDVIADMLFNSKFEPQDIKKEKGVIIEEINMGEDLPEDVLADLHSKASWGDDPISLPILGTIDTVNSFNRQQILDYVEKYYIPQNSVLSISGKFEVDNTLNLIKRYFGNWVSHNKKVTLYSKPKILNNHMFKKKSIEQLHMTLGIPGIDMDNEDMYALSILNSIFGGGASSLLFQKIREEKGLCYSIYSYISSFENTGIINIYNSLNSKYCENVIYMIKEEIYKFTKNGINNKKLEVAKEQLKGSYILGLESTSSRMFSNGRSMLFLNKIKVPEDIIAKIDSVTSDDINRVMDYTFKNGIVNSAFVGDDINLDNIKNLIEKDIDLFNTAGNKKFV
ncbi:insulinase family protein [Clostridium fermenticellae]|uniref:Insulinase family protein n=1 Tax=Clostridium fermenticellae TaxID=2068654 RepID=A0A386H3A9_9CLOT|nr:pitrilysin family protein [Clostridium fermenticellae]AYD40078.1 insulinase family protein [Clostridium fermenticellae]